MPSNELILRLLDKEVRVVGRATTLTSLSSIFRGSSESHCLALSDDYSTVEVRDPDPADGLYRILVDGAQRWEHPTSASLIGAIEATITSEALKTDNPHRLLFHGGSVAWGTNGLIFPASPGSGKTTLVAGLLRNGFRYLSDEVVVLDPRSRELSPFERSLCIKEGSLAVLEPRYPGLSSLARFRRFGLDLATYLPPPVDSWPTEKVTVRHVVLPRYEAGATTELAPVARSIALQRLLEQSFNARRQGPASVQSIVKLVREMSCWSLKIGNLTDAISVIQDLVVT